MKTKLILTIAGLVLSASTMNAQASDCVTKASIAYEHAKVKNWVLRRRFKEFEKRMPYL